MANFWRLVNDVISDADVLLLLLDARLVDETRNLEIEDKVKRAGKPLIYVITKCDLVDKADAEKHKKYLKPCVFVSATMHHGTTLLREKILIEAKRMNHEHKTVRVGVLGYPNVGKSSLINAMKGKRSAPTSMMSGYTKSVQNIRADNRVMFIDTPGVIPYQEKDELKHSFIGTIDFTKSKEPDMIILELMERFPGIIEKYYHVDVKDDKEETLEDITVKQHILIKGGKPDTVRMARMILKDWQKGLIKQ